MIPCKIQIINKNKTSHFHDNFFTWKKRMILLLYIWTKQWEQNFCISDFIIIILIPVNSTECHLEVFLIFGLLTPAKEESQGHFWTPVSWLNNAWMLMTSGRVSLEVRIEIRIVQPWGRPALYIWEEKKKKGGDDQSSTEAFVIQHVTKSPSWETSDCSHASTRCPAVCLSPCECVCVYEMDSLISASSCGGDKGRGKFISAWTRSNFLFLSHRRRATWWMGLWLGNDTSVIACHTSDWAPGGGARIGCRGRKILGNDSLHG